MLEKFRRAIALQAVNGIKPGIFEKKAANRTGSINYILFISIEQRVLSYSIVTESSCGARAIIDTEQNGCTL